jgi:hypothetical protein
MKKPKKDPDREDRIHNEAIADANGPEEQVMIAPEDACSADMLVLIRWHGRTMAVPLSQLVAIDPDHSTAEAVGDWHYWVAHGYCF